MLIFRGMVNATFLYFPFMLLGYYSFGKKEIIFEKIKVSLLVVLFIVLFVIKIWIFQEKLLPANIEIMFNLVLALTGTYGFWGMADKLTHNNNVVEYLGMLSQPSYGAYVIHQFVLVTILRWAILPTCLLGPVFPWGLSLFICIVSFGGSCLALKTKAGRFLIG